MSGHLARLASFASWPSTATVSSLTLARSDFRYTGHGESTICVECQLVVDSWQSGDRPDEVHRQRSLNCPFVQSQMQANDSRVSLAAAGSVEEENPNSVAYNIDRNSPDFERLKAEEVRLSTFHDWPSAHIVESCDLAKAGLFYTGQIDRVQCAFCGGYLHNWVQGDNPAEEHRRHFPKCLFIQQQQV